MSKKADGWLYFTTSVSVVMFGLSIWSKSKEPILENIGDSEWIYFLCAALLVPIYRILLALEQKVIPPINGISSLIDKTLLARGNIRLIGDAIQAAERVCERLETATVVLNTYITVGNPYSPDVERKVTAAIERFVRRNRSIYEETISHHGKERAEKIMSAAKGDKGNYRCRVIKSSFNGFPVCNFVILFHPVGSPIEQEVFFGWGYFYENLRESVLWSNDPAVIGFFRGYHKALRADSVSESFNTKQ